MVKSPPSRTRQTAGMPQLPTTKKGEFSFGIKCFAHEKVSDLQGGWVARVDGWLGGWVAKVARGNMWPGGIGGQGGRCIVGVIFAY